MKRFIVSFFLFASFASVYAQVNGVEFGKNRVQYKKFKWQFYQSDNFNTYFNQEGNELARYVAKLAETELPSIEKFVEYGLQRRINIVVYNTFDDLRQSNIGMGIDWQNTGGVTKLVNNKMPIYFDGNHTNLKKQIREGLARVLVENLLFGDDLGEVAANQALLDLPKWLTDGYIHYTAEDWNVALDDDLRATILSGQYRNFYQFAFEKPDLAGHAFWKYYADKFGKDKVSYFLYLARIYKNLNTASQKIAQKKFKFMLQDFMLEVPQQYYKDLQGRRNAPKGQLAISKTVGKIDYIRFNANPVPKSFTYAYVEYRNGKYCVVLMENFVSRKVLVSYGERMRQNEIAPNYPILAWDGKGTRLAVSYWEKGKLKLFVYDLVNRLYAVKQDLPMFTQITDMKYMLDRNTLLISAVRKGQSDIYVYKMDSQQYEQITNDVYDDLDPAFVAFPGKTGIIYASNRPAVGAPPALDSFTKKHFNIYLIDNWNKTEFKQVSQLTDLSNGNARYPSQYNTSHFTFVSDENGINNRYAGFFKSERVGIDTLVYIDNQVLRNPPVADVDSMLLAFQKNDIDSVKMISISNDSSYIFPLTNYQSSLLESRASGDQQQVSEVVKLGDSKLLYRLRVDENVLRRRNIITRPTEYVKQRNDLEKLQDLETEADKASEPGNGGDGKFFQNEFGTDSSQTGAVKGVEGTAEMPKEIELNLFNYKPWKFHADYAVTGFNNSVLAITKYQAYGGGAGPIRLANGTDFNGLIRMGTSELMEDYKITGGIRLAPNLKDNDILFEIYNFRKRIDWGVTFYRSANEVSFSNLPQYQGKTFSTYYLGRINYPFSRTTSLRATLGPRFDRTLITARDRPSLRTADVKESFFQLSMEYVYDNVINTATNIWHGLRYKIYSDQFMQLSKTGGGSGEILYNAGFDARHYLPIYRNFIWAVRAAGDFSFGDQKVVYYLGGVDNWLGPKFDDEPRPTQNYTYQSLAVNMRGYNQNLANGNNAIVINSELRLPLFSTLFNRPINNAFLRNFQLTQFIDLGTAWEGGIENIKRPERIYSDDPSVTVRFKSGGIGPLAGGYGFGVRSTLLGYFLRLDAGWEMNAFFRGKPKLQFGMGLDF